MNFLHFQSFMTTADCKSITAAAKTLFISPTSLMQQLNLLEKELGFKVFNRSRKGVTLTAAGQKLYDGCKILSQQTNDLLLQCKSLAQNDLHRISISLVRPYYLMQLGDSFHTECPDTYLEFDRADPLTWSSIEAHLSTGTFDMMQLPVGFVPDDSPYEIIPFPDDILCCVCSKDHPFSSRNHVTLDDLNGMTLHTFSNFSEPLVMLQSAIQEKGYNIRLEPLQFSDQSVIKCCANHGIYIAQRQVAVTFNYLSVIPIYPPLSCTHGLIYRKNAKPAVQHFAQYVREHMDVIAAQYE